MLESIGQNPKGKGLSLLSCLPLCVGVGKNAGEFRYLGDPASVVFLLGFDREPHNSYCNPHGSAREVGQ
jgi:hypothetical protein